MRFAVTLSIVALIAGAAVAFAAAMAADAAARTGSGRSRPAPVLRHPPVGAARDIMRILPRSGACVHRRQRFRPRGPARQPARHDRDAQRAERDVPRVQSRSRLLREERQGSAKRRLLLGRPRGHARRAGPRPAVRRQRNEQPRRGLARRPCRGFRSRTVAAAGVRRRCVLRNRRRPRGDHLGARRVRAEPDLLAVLVEVRRGAARQGAASPRKRSAGWVSSPSRRKATARRAMR